jgi:hypothetical protein
MQTRSRRYSWGNWGPSWHIDHIKPLADFDLTDTQQAKEACHYTNLQPLFAQENWEKNRGRKGIRK